MYEIKETEVISTHIKSDFNNELDSVIRAMQNNNLEVEVQYQTTMVGCEVMHSALVIGKDMKVKI